jgi:hypothetical protein
MFSLLPPMFERYAAITTRVDGSIRRQRIFAMPFDAARSGAPFCPHRYADDTDAAVRRSRPTVYVYRSSRAAYGLQRSRSRCRLRRFARHARLFSPMMPRLSVLPDAMPPRVHRRHAQQTSPLMLLIFRAAAATAAADISLPRRRLMPARRRSPADCLRPPF